MPNYRRLYIPGGTFFFTLTLADRRSDYLVRYIDLLRSSWRDVMASWPFETVAAVVLPDRMHVVLTLPDGDSAYPARLRLLKQRFTMRLPETVKAGGRKGERGVWQPRYWEHAIRDAGDLDAHVNYIHFNPVKHGYVTTMDEWPYSTWHRFQREFGEDRRMIEPNIDVGER